MPSRYIVKIYAEDSFYHVFNRGVEKRNIFLNKEDYNYMLHLFERYLSKTTKTDMKNRELPNYSKDVDLVAYCLMPNHYHVLLYQKNKDGMEKLMRSVGTAYTMYFNKKYNRVGSLFQDRYKAVLVDADSYFTHISRYIHLNPVDIQQDYLSYEYSSLVSWLDIDKRPEWLFPDRVLSEFSSKEEYKKFLAEYKDVKAEFAVIKKELKE